MLQAPQTLGEEASKLSKDFDRGNMRFDSRDKIVAQIKLLTPQKLADFFHQAVVEPQGMAILSQISGSQNGKAEYVHPEGWKVWENVSALQQTMPLMSERMSDVAETLDPLRLPLQGERLIEASAGTGKTFTIAALYLRLLLGLGGSAAFPRPLTVEELLVVTFTEAATAELRGRIRSNIHELRIACLRETTDNPLYKRLLEEIDDKAQAAQWLLLAERQMDEAAVFTIHGFCQRMLNLNAFESGMLFEQQLIEDESLLRYQACADFWRRHCYPLPREIALVVFETWKGPQALLRDINRYLQGEAPVIKAPPPDDETLASRHAQIVARIDARKTAVARRGG
ncbi:exonuclease V subunit beta [Escherichia coli]|uniref:Exonuclease V subunit beta n=1 Tax=Escherichia coli TaxID=562 RepID=A0A485JAP2_ECOLX|nr:exonuclease V subunit beta [Escherichia coli]